MLLKVPVAKAGKEAFIEVETDQIVDTTVYEAIFLEGLKACLNSKMTKVGPVTKLEGKDLADAKATALEIAAKNLAALKDGSFKFPGAKAKTTAPRDVMNEAVRLAREVIRDQIRAHRITISHVPAKDITTAARKLVENNPSYIAKAEAELAKRKQVPTDTIDLSALGIHADPEKVAKAEASKAERNARAKTLSKTQAGKVKGRTKPKADINDVLAAASAGTAGAPKAAPLH